MPLAGRPVLLYVALVGLPLAGLLGLLQAGRGLDVPPRVGGVWVLDGALPCLGGAERLEIVQSGRYLQGAVGDARLDGRLDGGRLRLRGRLRASVAPGACSAGPFEIAAEVPDGVPERLAGRVAMAACPGCPQAAFAARRATGARAAGRAGH